LPFFPASTVCSTWHFAGLLHPAADPGVRHVSGRSSRLASPDPSTRQGGGVPRFPVTFRLHPEGASFQIPSADHVAGFARPRRALLTLTTRLALVSLGPFPMALHPSELFPRQQLFRVNRAFQSHSRPSAVPGRTRFWCLVWSVDRPYGSGHRSRCLLAVVRGFFLPRFGTAQAQRVHVAGLHRSLDLKAFVR
jgi:hypothetical protein